VPAGRAVSVRALQIAADDIDADRRGGGAVVAPLVRKASCPRIGEAAKIPVIMPGPTPAAAISPASASASAAPLRQLPVDSDGTNSFSLQ
jgi:hypothetical protein